MTTPMPYMDFANRVHNLNAAINRSTQEGWRLESTPTPTMAYMVVGSLCDHTSHLLATIFSCGLWSPIWIICAFVQKERRMTIGVDEYGEVTYSQVAVHR